MHYTLDQLLEEASAMPLLHLEQILGKEEVILVKEALFDSRMPVIADAYPCDRHPHHKILISIASRSEAGISRDSTKGFYITNSGSN